MYQSLHTTVMALGGQPARDPDPHPGDAPASPSTASPRTGATRKAAPRTRKFDDEDRLAAAAAGLAARRRRRRRSSSSRSRPTSSRTRSTSSRRKGEIKEMPAGATPLDFAYRVHTDVGHHCVGAQGQRPAGAARLSRSRTATSSRSSRRKRLEGPSRDWLNPNLGYIKTGHAREKIRQWFRRQQREENIDARPRDHRQGAAAPRA